MVTNLARASTANAQFPEAEKLYLGVVSRDKTHVQSYMELYRLYMFQNKPDQAEAILKKAIENNPKRYELLINLAQHYYGHKRRDEVVKVLETLKSHAKDYPEAFEQAGAFYFRLGDGAEAMRQYEEGIKANPDKKAFYQKLIIEVLMAQGKKEDAKKVNDSILAAESERHRRARIAGRAAARPRRSAKCGEPIANGRDAGRHRISSPTTITAARSRRRAIWSPLGRNFPKPSACGPTTRRRGWR